MKKSLSIVLALAAALCVSAVAHAAGSPIPLDLAHAAIAQFAQPDIAMGLAGLGAAGITTFVQDGDVLDLDAGTSVATGVGHLFGEALFGVAVVDAVSGTKSAFIVEGVVTIGKTSALAISVGDRLFWDPSGKVVNKTTTAQQQVGIAVEAAADPSSTVKMLLESAVPVAT